MSKLRVLFFLLGSRAKASSRVRGFWIADALVEKHFKCCMEHRLSKKAMFQFLLRIPLYDIIFFQKTYSRWHCLLLRFAKLLSKKIIFDLDDAPSRTNHPTTLRNVEFMLRNASAVTVGSQVLFDYASIYSQNVYLIPSSINLKYYQPIEKTHNMDELVCLGWIGNGKHYTEDLISILREPLTDIASKHPVRFKLIGACGVQELYETFKDVQGLELDFIDQIEWSDPQEITKTLQDIDIGLYPLLPNESNRYKCGFKALEYMAMGVPVVSSNVAENRDIVEHGVNGYIVETSSDWSSALSQLIADSQLRKRLGLAGRRKVEERYSVSETARRLQYIFCMD